MLTLCGFAFSNYYNKVKLAMLEKGVAFEESLVWPDRSEAFLSKTPLGKVPYLETPHGTLVESQVQVNFIEVSYPEHPLLPKDPFAAAKVHELVTFLDVHLELVARELYAEAYFGSKVSDETREKGRKLLTKNIAAFAKLAKFGPFIAGDTFTIADCAAICHLPLVQGVGIKLFGEDMLASMPVAGYLKAMAERPTVQKMAADRKENQSAFFAHYSK
jgi:glutathione S-transferase